MKRLMIIIAVVAAGQALALAPLSQVKQINDGLRDMFVADQLRIVCPTLEARMIRGWAFARELQNKARAIGYSKEQIDDFVESKKERRRIEREAQSYMVARGVKAGQPNTYCALGREEIAKASQIGALLRAK